MTLYGQSVATQLVTIGQPEPSPIERAALHPDEPAGNPSYRRNEVINRMLAVNLAHTIKAWEHRRSQPACPHALTFLYRQVNPGSPFERIFAATGMYDADEDAVDLGRWLDRMIKVASGHRRNGPLDPAQHMTISTDIPSADDGAELFGVAVSTLDGWGSVNESPRFLTWAEQQRAARDDSDIAGRCLILLAEKPPTHHSLIVVERGAPRRVRFNPIIRSTVDLSYQLGLVRHDWTRVPSMAELLVDEEVWQLLFRLHLLAFDQRPRPRLLAPQRKAI